MSWTDKAEARAEAAVAARRARLVAAVTGRLDEIGGITATATRDGIELTGRDLLRRWLSDARLRFAGSKR